MSLINDKPENPVAYIDARSSNLLDSPLPNLVFRPLPQVRAQGTDVNEKVGRE